MNERGEECHKLRGKRGQQVLQIFTTGGLGGVWEAFPHVCSTKTPAGLQTWVLQPVYVCFCCISACWISAAIAGQPPHHAVQIHHAGSGQANDLPCSVVPCGPPVIQNFPAPRSFQPPSTSFQADRGIVYVPLPWIAER